MGRKFRGLKNIMTWKVLRDFKKKRSFFVLQKRIIITFIIWKQIEIYFSSKRQNLHFAHVINAVSLSENRLEPPPPPFVV